MNRINGSIDSSISATNFEESLARIELLAIIKPNSPDE